MAAPELQSVSSSCQISIMSSTVCPLGWVLLHQVCLHTGQTPGGHSWHQALSLCRDIEESKDRLTGWLEHII